MATAKLKSPLQQVNKYGIAPRQWKKWSDLAQRVFNGTYGHMLKNQTMYLHPGCDPVRAEYWKTTVHNAAWIAADACEQGLKDIIDCKGYAKVGEKAPAKKVRATKVAKKKAVK